MSILVSLVLVCVAVVGCSSGSSTPATSPIQALTDQVAAISSRLNQVETKAAQIDPALRNDLNSVIMRVSQLEATSNNNDEVDLSPLQTLINSVASRVATLEQSQQTNPEAPKYVMVTAIRKKSCDITVYGEGDFSIAVTFYGSDMITGVVEPDDDDVAEIADEYINGTYALNVLPDIVSWSGVTGLPVQDGVIPLPNSHTHTVTVNGKMYTLTFNSTSLTVIVSPVKPWTNGQVVRLDVSDLLMIEYATASIAIEE